MIHDSQLDYYGRRLATCSTDRTIKIFTVDTKTLEATLTGHEGPVWQVCWAHPKHGQAMLASCGYDGRVIIWVEEGRGIWREYYRYAWHASSVNCVEFASHEYGLVFACASSDGFVSVCRQLGDGTWDERRVSESREGVVHTHPLGANSVSFAPAVAKGGLWMMEKSGPPVMRIVTGGSDGLIKIWKCEDDGEWKLDGKVLMGHKDLVRCVSWAPNVGLLRDLIASAGGDSKVCVWEKEDGQAEWKRMEVGAFDKTVWSVSWTPTGSVLGVACGDDNVSLWKEDADGKWLNVSEIMQDGAQAKIN